MSWLEQLKVGDKVIVSGYSSSIGTVSRFTKTQILVKVGGSEYRFNRHGRQVGTSGYYAKFLHEYSDEAEQKIREKQLRDKYRNANLSYLSIETLRTIDQIVRTCGETKLEHLKG